MNKLTLKAQMNRNGVSAVSQASNRQLRAVKMNTLKTSIVAGPTGPAGEPGGDDIFN